MWFKIQKDGATRLAPGNVRNNRINKLNESRILAGYYGFNANISFTFQAIKNLSAYPTYLCFGPFCKFFGDF